MSATTRIESTTEIMRDVTHPSRLLKNRNTVALSPLMPEMSADVHHFVPATRVMRFARRAAVLGGIVAAIGCGAFGASAQTTSSPAAPATLETTDARALYDAAYDRWRAIPRAPFATYEETVRIVSRGRPSVRRENVAYRRHDSRCLVVGIALDAHDRPDAPQVTDRCFSPDSSFTFLPHSGPLSAGPLPLDFATPSPADEPKTIGRISARARTYDPTYVGDEQIGTARAAHLALRAYGDVRKHVLRDIWIDRATRGVMRLHGDAALATRVASVDFTVDYDETATTQIVRHVAGYAKAQLLLVKLGADFDFSLVREAYPASLPPWYFEKNGYVAHHSPPLGSS